MLIGAPDDAAGARVGAARPGCCACGGGYVPGRGGADESYPSGIRENAGNSFAALK